MNFADTLKRLRTEDNLTQYELSKRLGVSESRISMYERGQREPDFETLEVIADYFNVDMNTLLGVSSGSSPAPQVSDLKKRFIHEVMDMDEDLVRDALDVFEILRHNRKDPG